MNINNIDNNMRNGSLPETFEKAEPVTQNDVRLDSLSKITDSASLSALVPRLQNLLAVIDHPDDNLLKAMSDNISRLQDAFVETVYATLGHNSFDLNEKITLRLDKNEQLQLLGEHPEKERLNDLLGNMPELSSAFKEIASQSEILRDVGNIGKVIHQNSGINAYRNMAGINTNANYQISIKGEMSHFYFSKA